MVHRQRKGGREVPHQPAAGNTAGIGGIQKIPAITFYDNAIMGILLMEESLKADIEKFVAIGSACSYPKYGNIPLKESEICPKENK